MSQYNPIINSQTTATLGGKKVPVVQPFEVMYMKNEDEDEMPLRRLSKGTEQESFIGRLERSNSGILHIEAKAQSDLTNHKVLKSNFDGFQIVHEEKLAVARAHHTGVKISNQVDANVKNSMNFIDSKHSIPPPNEPSAPDDPSASEPFKSNFPVQEKPYQGLEYKSWYDEGGAMNQGGGDGGYKGLEYKSIYDN